MSALQGITDLETAAKVLTIFDPFLILFNWIVLAILVHRLRKKYGFGSFGSMAKSHESNNKSSSLERDDVGDDSGSGSRPADTAKAKSVKRLWRRRIIYTLGVLVSMSIRTVDPLAQRFEGKAYLYVVLAGTWYAAMFGTLWVCLFVYSHVCAYYVAATGPPVPEWAPKGHLAYEIYTFAIHIVIAPIALASHRTELIGMFFILGATPPLLFAIALLKTVNSLHKRLTSGDVAEMIVSRDKYERRAKNVRKFYIMGNVQASFLIFAAVTGNFAGILCLTDGAYFYADINPPVLNLILWMGHIVPYFGLATLLWIQWEGKAVKKNHEGHSRPRPHGDGSNANIPNSSFKSLPPPQLQRASSARPASLSVDRDRGGSAAHIRALSLDYPRAAATSQVALTKLREQTEAADTDETKQCERVNSVSSIIGDGDTQLSTKSETV